MFRVCGLLKGAGNKQNGARRSMRGLGRERVENTQNRHSFCKGGKRGSLHVPVCFIVGFAVSFEDLGDADGFGVALRLRGLSSVF